MALKDIWVDRIDGVDANSADDINQIAHAVIELEQQSGAPCLAGDTLILMSDGTEKPIEKIQPGEMVKSWDFNNNCFIDVKCYGSHITGMCTEWSRFVFRNGSYLDIDRNHQLYAIGKKRLYPSNAWISGTQGFVIDKKAGKTEPEGIHYAATTTYQPISPERRYTLATENALYFANGILAGCTPHNRYQRYLNKQLLDATEEEIARFKHFAEYAKEYRNQEALNPDYIAEVSGVKWLIERANIRIKNNKDKLSNLDYKTVKHAQGVLSEEDWTCICDECEAYRQAINEDEELLVTYDSKLQTLKEKYSVNTKSWKEIYDYFYDLDMQAVYNRKMNNNITLEKI